MRVALSSLPRRALMLMVRGYQLLLSPWLAPSCRFAPTCSAYALQALEQHGALAGTGLTLYRVLRCNPFCEGGRDPVPGRPPRLFRHLVTRRADAPGAISSSPLDNQTSP